MSDRHRFERARTRAGLSLGQAAKLLGVDRGDLARVEQIASIEKSADLELMANLYGVSVEWLTGVAPQYDYDRVKAMTGSERLTPRDRDELAELAASMPTTKRLTLAEIASRRKIPAG